MYYVMECLTPTSKRRSLIDFRDTDRDRLWNAGHRFKTNPDIPVRATIRTQPDSVLLELWQVPLPLMSRRLLKSILSAGVDNLDVFPAELFDPRTNQKYTDYFAFNVVGVIGAADLSKSKYNAPDGGSSAIDFHSLILDEEKIHGVLLFRLAEAVNALIIHESIRNRIELDGIHTLTFLEPSSWAG